MKMILMMLNDHDDVDVLFEISWTMQTRDMMYYYTLMWTKYHTSCLRVYYNLTKLKQCRLQASLSEPTNQIGTTARLKIWTCPRHTSHKGTTNLQPKWTMKRQIQYYCTYLRPFPTEQWRNTIVVPGLTFLRVYNYTCAIHVHVARHVRTISKSLKSEAFLPSFYLRKKSFSCLVMDRNYLIQVLSSMPRAHGDDPTSVAHVKVPSILRVNL